MAKTSTPKRPVAKTRSPSRKKTVRKKTAKKIPAPASPDIIDQLSDSARKQLRKLGDKFHNEKDIMPQMSEATREQLRKLGDKVGEATDKGVHKAREVAGRVRHFAAEATELTKLKIELHKLKNSQDKLIFTIGEKLVGLNKAKKLSRIASTFADDFTRLDEIKTQISEKEKAIRKISL